MKKLRNTVVLICVMVGVIFYAHSVYQVNKDNNKTKVTYLDDTVTNTVDGIKYTFSEEQILDASSLFDKYLGMEELYPDIGSKISEGGLGQHKFLLLKLQVENISDARKQIDLADLYAKSKAWYNTVSPDLFHYFNGEINFECIFYAGAKAEFILPYELLEAAFSDEHFRKIEKQPFTILVKGYPEIQEVRLTQIQSVKGDVEELYKKAEQASDIEDTAAGEFLSMSDECVVDGIGYCLEDVQYYTNVNEYPVYKEKCFFDKESLINAKGDVKDAKGNISAGQRNVYMVFIKSKIKNHGGTKKKVDVRAQGLGWYVGDNYQKKVDVFYLDCPKSDNKAYATLNPDEEIEAITGFLVINHKKYWDIDKTELYVSLCERAGMSDPDKEDPKKGLVGEQNYFVVKEDERGE